MGIVHETSNIYDDLSAWQNLMFTAELYTIGKKEREQRGKELLELFGLWDRRNDKVHGFSKGMKRRLTLAMGLINNPRLLFLDEPTSGLDVQSNLIIRDVIRDLNLHRGYGLSHDPQYRRGKPDLRPCGNYQPGTHCRNRFTRTTEKYHPECPVS